MLFGIKSNTIKKMITMCFYDNIYTGINATGYKFTHLSLALRM